MKFTEYTSCKVKIDIAVAISIPAIILALLSTGAAQNHMMLAKRVFDEGIV